MARRRHGNPGDRGDVWLRELERAAKHDPSAALAFDVALKRTGRTEQAAKHYAERLLALIPKEWRGAAYRLEIDRNDPRWERVVGLREEVHFLDGSVELRSLKALHAGHLKGARYLKVQPYVSLNLPDGFGNPRPTTLPWQQEPTMTSGVEIGYRASVTRESTPWPYEAGPMIVLNGGGELEARNAPFMGITPILWNVWHADDRLPPRLTRGWKDKKFIQHAIRGYTGLVARALLYGPIASVLERSHELLTKLLERVPEGPRGIADLTTEAGWALSSEMGSAYRQKQALGAMFQSTFDHAMASVGVLEYPSAMELSHEGAREIADRGLVTLWHRALDLVDEKLAITQG